METALHKAAQVPEAYGFNQRASRQSFWVLLAFSVLISVCGVYLTRTYLMDDALITLRYSQNFARYGVPIWNQADLRSPSMGYTSTLWMAINTVPALVSRNKDMLVLMAKLFSLVALLAIVWLISREVFSLPISTPLKFLAVFIVFSQLGYGLHVNSAMETMLFSCVLLLAVRAYAKSHYRLAYVLGALSFLARPEGALLVGLFCFWDLTGRRTRNALVGGFAFLVLVAGTALLLHHWYGDVLPNAFYKKQRGIDTEALTRTVFFIATLALPFLLMSVHAAVVAKNRVSYYMLMAAVVLIAYYVTVDPIMNVLSRYQWPSLVLMTYASLPTVGFLGADIRRRKLAVSALLLMLIADNAGNCLGANYFANVTGHAERNVVMIGKKMAAYRDSNKWLVYHDAGAICYFSDWNTYETVGLTNSRIVKRQIRVADIYRNPDAQIVLKNFDLMYEDQQADKREYTRMLSGYGYHYVQDFPILFVSGQRNFVVAAYARDTGFADTVFHDVRLTAPLKPDFTYALYRIAKRVVRGR